MVDADPKILMVALATFCLLSVIDRRRISVVQPVGNYPQVVASRNEIQSCNQMVQLKNAEIAALQSSNAQLTRLNQLNAPSTPALPPSVNVTIPENGSSANNNSVMALNSRLDEIQKSNEAVMRSNAETVETINANKNNTNSSNAQPVVYEVLENVNAPAVPLSLPAPSNNAPAAVPNNAELQRICPCYDELTDTCPCMPTNSNNALGDSNGLNSLDAPEQSEQSDAPKWWVSEPPQEEEEDDDESDASDESDESEASAAAAPAVAVPNSGVTAVKPAPVPAANAAAQEAVNPFATNCKPSDCGCIKKPSYPLRAQLAYVPGVVTSEQKCQQLLKDDQSKDTPKCAALSGSNAAKITTTEETLVRQAHASGY